MNDDFHISKFGKELQALRITIITTISPIQEENYDMLLFFINDVWIVISGVNYNSIPKLQLAAIAYNWLSKLWSILWIAMFSNSFTQFHGLYIDYNCLQLPHLIMALIGDYLDYEQWLVQTITAGYWVTSHSVLEASRPEISPDGRGAGQVLCSHNAHHGPFVLTRA